MTNLPDNVRLVEVTGIDNSVTEHVIIDLGNNEFTSMLKSTYEAQQAAQAQNTTIIIPD
jgi:hypothetical protein